MLIHHRFGNLGTVINICTISRVGHVRCASSVLTAQLDAAYDGWDFCLGFMTFQLIGALRHPRARKSPYDNWYSDCLILSYDGELYATIMQRTCKRRSNQPTS